MPSQSGVCPLRAAGQYIASARRHLHGEAIGQGVDIDVGLMATGLTSAVGERTLQGKRILGRPSQPSLDFGL